MKKLNFIFYKTKKSQDLKKKLLKKYKNYSVKNSDVIAKNIPSCETSCQTIGSSGKTMRLVGNYTLAIAMLLIWGPTAFQSFIDINCAIVSIASTFIFKLCFKFLIKDILKNIFL